MAIFSCTVCRDDMNPLRNSSPISCSRISGAWYASLRPKKFGDAAIAAAPNRISLKWNRRRRPCGGPSGSRCRPRARESMDKEEERAPYAILRATSHVIVDPVANSAPWDHAAAAPQARQQSPGTLIRSTISIAAVCACERRAPVQRRAQIMFRNGQLCA